jgi:hypothetical protein
MVSVYWSSALSTLSTGPWSLGTPVFCRTAASVGSAGPAAELAAEQRQPVDAVGLGALGEVGADPDRGEDREGEQRSHEDGDQLRSDLHVLKHCRPPCA